MVFVVHKGVGPASLRKSSASPGPDSFRSSGNIRGAPEINVFDVEHGECDVVTRQMAVVRRRDAGDTAISHDVCRLGECVDARRKSGQRTCHCSTMKIILPMPGNWPHSHTLTVGGARRRSDVRHQVCSRIHARSVRRCRERGRGRAPAQSPALHHSPRPNYELLYRVVIAEGLEVYVQGGAFFPDPTSAYLDGASSSGSCLRVGWIGIGLTVQIRCGDQCIITSPVRGIVIEPPSGSVAH